MSEPGTGVAYAVGPTARPPVAPLARAAQDSLARANRALLIVGCLVVLSISHGVDADLWGHVRYGQDVLAAHALPVTASHTYTAVGHPWINHENLAELAFGWIETHLGAERPQRGGRIWPRPRRLRTRHARQPLRAPSAHLADHRSRSAAPGDRRVAPARPAGSALRRYRRPGNAHRGGVHRQRPAARPRAGRGAGGHRLAVLPACAPSAVPRHPGGLLAALPPGWAPGPSQEGEAGARGDTAVRARGPLAARHHVGDGARPTRDPRRPVAHDVGEPEPRSGRCPAVHGGSTPRREAGRALRLGAVRARRARPRDDGRVRRPAFPSGARA